MTRYKSRKLFWVAAPLLLLGVVLAPRPVAQASLSPGDTMEVQKGLLIQKTTVAGAVMPLRRSMVSAPYNAYLKKIYVKLGQTVKQGEPILSLAQTLDKNGSGVEERPLRAPFNGTVVQILRAEGEYIDAAKEGSGIVRVDDLSRKFVYTDVPEGDVGRIRVGMPVEVKINSILERTYKGTIREMALAAKEKKDFRPTNGAEYEVRIEILDADENIRSGMSSIVDIITARKDGVLMVPHEYVLKEDGEFFVTLENGQKKAVKVGAQNDDSVEIREGLAEKARVRKVDFAALPPST